MKKKKGITLVLSGGGARGLAHVGVLEVLEENKIPIERIVGTSAGAAVGGIYCAGKMKEMKEYFTKLKKWDVFKLLFSLPAFGHIFNSQRIDAKLKEFTENKKIENLKIPFIAVAFDIIKGKRVILNRGNLFDAVRSSMAIPGFFKPFQIGESILVDGGVADILPVRVAKRYSKNGKIVAVNVESSIIKGMNNYNFFNILSYASYFQTRELSKFEEKQADVVIRPSVTMGTFEFQKSSEIINEGRKAAKRALPAIKALLEDKEPEIPKPQVITNKT